MEQTPTETKTYQIGGLTYRLEPASLEQHEWLKDGPLTGVDFGAVLTERDLAPLVQAHGAEILGIVLLVDGMTREQKGEAGLAAAQALALTIKRQLTPSEVRDLAFDFFTIDGYKNMAFFIDFPALWARMDAERMAQSSTPVSASLPMAIAPSARPSNGSAAPVTASSSSSAPPNGDSPSVPSSAFVG